MSVFAAVPLAAIAGHRDGRVTAIWDLGGSMPIINACDCHGWAWPALMITYHPGADSYDCPVTSGYLFS